MPDRFYDFYNFPSWIISMHEKYRDHAQSFKRVIEPFFTKESSELTRGTSERDILPILHLIGHYLELMLKAIILTNRDVVLITHNLQDIYAEAQSVHPEFQLSAQSILFLGTLTQLAPDGHAFRYPTNIKMQENFTTKNPAEIRGIRLSTVVLQYGVISSELESFYSRFQLHAL